MRDDQLNWTEKQDFPHLISLPLSLSCFPNSPSPPFSFISLFLFLYQTHRVCSGGWGTSSARAPVPTVCVLERVCVCAVRAHMCLSRWCEKSRGTHLLSLLVVGFQFDALNVARVFALTHSPCMCVSARERVRSLQLRRRADPLTAALQPMWNNSSAAGRLARLLKKRICPSATGDWRLHCLPLLR